MKPYNKGQAVELGSEILNRVWAKWAQINIPNSNAYKYAAKYRAVNRNDPTAQYFEEWLFDQGAVVARKDITYISDLTLVFTDPHDATVFVLKNL